MKAIYLDKFFEYRNHSNSTTGSRQSLDKEKMNIDEVLQFILKVNPKSCKQYVISENTQWCLYLYLWQVYKSGADSEWRHCIWSRRAVWE